MLSQRSSAAEVRVYVQFHFSKKTPFVAQVVVLRGDPKERGKSSVGNSVLCDFSQSLNQSIAFNSRAASSAPRGRTLFCVLIQTTAIRLPLTAET